MKPFLSVRRADATAVATHATAVLMVFAPLIRGGNRPIPLMLLELAALGLLGYCLWRPRFVEHLSRPLLWVLGAMLVYPLVQLLPLPGSLWSLLPGRAYYAELLALADPSGDASAWRPISLIPAMTESAWLALLPPLAVFLLVVGLPSKNLRYLMLVFLAIALFEALFGLIQYREGPFGMLRLGIPHPHGGDSATGTYVNRNHLGALLVMAFPIVSSLLIANVGRTADAPERASRGRDRSRGQQASLRNRIAELGTWRMNLSVFYGAAAIAILVGLIFTRSRTSIALAMLGLMLCMAAFSRRVGRNNVYGMFGTLTTVAIVLALVVGLAPVWDRFALADNATDYRWGIFTTTFQAIGQFLPLGSGFGTFTNIFPRFQTPELIGYINHVHNDYLEWILEGGLVSAAVIVGFGWFYVKRWTQVWYRGTWSTFRFIQVGAGISILLLALHGLVDFNFHIPANAIFFAFLAGVFFHRYSEEARDEAAVAHPKEITEGTEEVSMKPRDTSIPPENQVDPFA